MRVGAGALRAIGTAGDRITFTSGSGDPGDWRGVGAWSTNNQNAFPFVTMDDAGEQDTEINGFTGANLYVASSGRIAVSDSAGGVIR